MKSIFCYLNFLQKLPLLLMFVILSGCTRIVSYTEPTSGPVARVRFATDTSDIHSNTVISEFDSTDCKNKKKMMVLRDGLLIGMGGKTRALGIPLNNYHKNAAREFLVTSEVPHVYMFKHMVVESSLILSSGVFIKQTFEKDKDYELIYKKKGLDSWVEVNEIKTNLEGVSKKILIQKKTNKLPKGISKRCLKAFKENYNW